MRQLLPEPIDEVDPFAVYAADDRPPGAERPWLLVNMVTTADGATDVGGRSGHIGGPADRDAFHALRACADAVLVAAGTARTEGYGPARPRPDGSPGPRIVVVTRTGDLDPAARLFSGGEPLVLTCDGCPADRRRALAAVAEVVVAGDGSVDLPAGLAELRQRGLGVVLCEGGPTLNAQLIALDLVDEWCLSLAPSLAGGRSKRAAEGDLAPPSPHPMRLARLLEADGLLLARYVRTR